MTTNRNLANVAAHNIVVAMRRMRLPQGSSVVQTVDNRHLASCRTDAHRLQLRPTGRVQDRADPSSSDPRRLSRSSQYAQHLGSFALIVVNGRQRELALERIVNRTR